MTYHAFDMPMETQASVSDSAPLLLCHDIVELGSQSEDQASWRTCIHNASLLLGEARRRHWHIAHTFCSGPAPEPVGALRPFPEEPVFQCHGPNIFLSNGLSTFLSANSPCTIFLTGRSSLLMSGATLAACSRFGVPICIVSDAVSLPKGLHVGPIGVGSLRTVGIVQKFASTTTTAHVLTSMAQHCQAQRI
jgi:hypothetical protein